VISQRPPAPCLPRTASADPLACWCCLPVIAALWRSFRRRTPGDPDCWGFVPAGCQRPRPTSVHARLNRRGCPGGDPKPLSTTNAARYRIALPDRPRRGCLPRPRSDAGSCSAPDPPWACWARLVVPSACPGRVRVWDLPRSPRTPQTSFPSGRSAWPSSSILVPRLAGTRAAGLAGSVDAWGRCRASRLRRAVVCDRLAATQTTTSGPLSPRPRPHRVTVRVGLKVGALALLTPHTTTADYLRIAVVGRRPGCFKQYNLPNGRRPLPTTSITFARQRAPRPAKFLPESRAEAAPGVQRSRDPAQGPEFVAWKCQDWIAGVE